MTSVEDMPVHVLFEKPGVFLNDITFNDLKTDVMSRGDITVFAKIEINGNIYKISSPDGSIVIEGLSTPKMEER